MFQKIRNAAAKLAPAISKPPPPKPAKVGHGSQSTFRPASSASPVSLGASPGASATSRPQQAVLSGADVGRLTAQRGSNPNLATLIQSRPYEVLDDRAPASASGPRDSRQPSADGSADLLRIRSSDSLALQSALARSVGISASIGSKVLTGAGELVAAAARNRALGTLLGGPMTKAAGALASAVARAEAYGQLSPAEQAQFEATRAELNDDPAALQAQDELLALGRVATPEEVAAYSRLSEAERRDFHTVSAQVKDTPEAQDALFETLVSGTLTQSFQVGPGLDGPQSTLLSEIARLGEGSENLSDADLARLTGELLVDIADPDGIMQGTNYGCAPTSVRAFLAMDNPAEYVRIAADLALTGSAELKMLNSQGEPFTLRRPTDKPLDPSRSFAEQLVGDTLLDAANGFFNRVGENNESESLLPFFPNMVGSSTTNGATAEWTARMMEMVTGEGHGFLGIGADSTGLMRMVRQGVLMRVIEDIHAQGGQPLVKIVVDGIGHSVRVTGMTEDTVTYYDPALGRETTISRQEFTSQTELVVAPDASMPDDEKLLKFLEQEESDTVMGQGQDSNRSQDLEPFEKLKMLRG